MRRVLQESILLSKLWVIMMHTVAGWELGSANRL